MRRDCFRVRGSTTFEGAAGAFEHPARKVSPDFETTEAPTGLETSPTASTRRVRLRVDQRGHGRAAAFLQR
jgi:hypothetical protein